VSTDENRSVASVLGIDAEGIADLRETHLSDPARTFQFMCMACGEPFPCRTLHLAAEVEQLRAQVAELTRNLRESEDECEQHRGTITKLERMWTDQKTGLERAERVIAAGKERLRCCSNAITSSTSTMDPRPASTCSVLGRTPSPPTTQAGPAGSRAPDGDSRGASVPHCADPRG
jgi:hypothetical protein